MELNDPSILSAIKSTDDIDLPAATMNTTNITDPNHIDKFFSDLQKKHQMRNENPSDIIDKGVTVLNKDDLFTHGEAHLDPFSMDYKPHFEGSNKLVYSINDFISIEKSLNLSADETLPEHITSIISNLPNKKFWRLNRKYSDPNNSNSIPNSLSNNYNYKDDRRNNNNNNIKSKNLKNVKTKRNSNNKYSGKHDRHGTLHNDEDNEDLMKLEKEFDIEIDSSSGHSSMKDFELWKAKMKELENKKKNNNNNSFSSKNSNQINLKNNNSISTTAVKSSLSDFFNSNSAPVTPSETEQPSAIKPDANTGSSRFSSFFSNAKESSSTNADNSATASQAPSEDTTKNPSQQQQQQQKPTSRLMPFFANESKSDELAKNISNQPKPTDPSKVMNPQMNVPTPTQTPTQNNLPPFFNHPPPAFMNGQQPLHPLPNNNAFFQDLLNKGKKIDSKDLQASPTAMMAPPGLAPLPSQQQNNPTQNNNNNNNNESNNNNSKQFPPNISVPPGFPMNMPPPHMMPPPPGFMPFPNQRQQPPFQGMINDKINNNVNDKNNDKNNTNRHPVGQNMLPQFMPGMMVPPGFPPMQGNMMPQPQFFQMPPNSNNRPPELQQRNSLNSK